jgi:hypothetical protein
MKKTSKTKNRKEAKNLFNCNQSFSDEEWYDAVKNYFMDWIAKNKAITG